MHIIEDNLDITESDNLVDFTIEDNCYVNDKFIGTTVAKKVTVNILNPNNEIDLENKEISIQTGITINGIEEHVPFGNYIIPKPENEEVKEKTSFVGYDYMIKFNVPYKDRVTYPCKAKVLFQDLCNQVGLEAGNIDFINCDYMILGNPFTNNEDCRTVLSNIAQLAGGFAKIGRDNKVYINTLSQIQNLLTVKYVDEMTVKELNLTTIKALIGNLTGNKKKEDESIDGNNYLDDFTKNKQFGEVNSLVIGLSNIEGENTALDDKTSINANGLTEIKIEDNSFLTNEKEREKVIVGIWQNLKGLKYLPFNVNYYGYPYIDSGDLIYIKDTKDIGYVSYVFNHTFTFNGAYSGKIETPAMTKMQTAYKNTFDLKSKFRRVERSVDKINGKIEDVIEQQTETGTKLSQHEQTIDGIRDTVSSVETRVEEIDQNIDTTVGEKVDNKMQNYPTKVEMNSAIEQKANSITSTVTEIKTQTIIKVEVMYALSSSETTAPTTGWSTTAPEWQENKYIWQKTINTYGNGTKDESNPTCISGKDGVNGIGVKELEEQYYLSTSNTTQTGGSWKNTQDEWTTGKYIWIRNKITWTDNTITYTTPILATGINQANEASSSFKQTADNITAEVRKKVGKDEIISRINQSAEGISINANKIDIEGKAVKFKTNIASAYSYSSTDLNNIQSYLMGTKTLTSSQKELYDIDKDGLVTASDYVRIRKLIGNSGGTARVTGTFEIDPDSASRSLILRDNNGEIITSIGLYGMKTESLNSTYLNTKYIYIGEAGEILQVDNNIELRISKSHFIISGKNGNEIIAFADGIMYAHGKIDMCGNEIINAGNVSSDRRLKKDIEDSKISAIDRIKQIVHRAFSWKKDNTKEEIGYIAQELEEIDSNYVRHNVTKDEEGNVTSDNYEVRILPLLSTTTKAIQEQQKIIEDLENRIKKLEGDR